MALCAFMHRSTTLRYYYYYHHHHLFNNDLSVNALSKCSQLYVFKKYIYLIGFSTNLTARYLIWGRFEDRVHYVNYSP